MILKSFYRKKSTKLYYILLSIIFIIVLSLYLIMNYLYDIRQKEYYKISLFYRECTFDCYDDLSDDSRFVNIKRTLPFEFIDGPIHKTSVGVNEIGRRVLAYRNESNELEDDELILYLNSTDYENEEHNFDNILKSYFNLRYNGKDYKFKVNKIYKAERASVIVSSSLFDNLVKYMNKFSVTGNFYDDFVAKEFDDTYESSSDDMMVSLDCGDARYDDIVKNYNIVHAIVLISIIIFIIISFIVIKNIISDLKENIFLEVRLGYSNFQVKLNIFKRLCTLHLLIFVTSAFIMSIIFVIARMYIKLTFHLKYLSDALLLLFVIIFSDLILSLILNNKSNLKKGVKV